MSALLHGRFWRILAAVAFLIATAAPAFAAFPSMPDCAGQGMAGSDCGGHKTKACALVACASPAVPAPLQAASLEPVWQAVTFPPGRVPLLNGALAPPEPFPPRAARSV